MSNEIDPIELQDKLSTQIIRAFENFLIEYPAESKIYSKHIISGLLNSTTVLISIILRSEMQDQPPSTQTQEFFKQLALSLSNSILNQIMQSFSTFSIKKNYVDTCSVIQ